MKKKTAAVVITVLSLAVITLGAFTLINHSKSEQYRRLTDAGYQHAFGELVNSLNEIDSALQKSVYSTSPQITGAICTQVFGKAMAAQMSLGMMPYSTVELEQTAGFVSRVGDYVFSLSRTAAKGEAMSEEAKENLRSLSETASLLAQNLNQLMIDMSEGRLTMDELSSAEKDADQAEGDAVPETLGGSIRLIEQEFPEVPSLIYDGPFSEHIAGAKPKMLENEKEVSEEQAKVSAAEFLGYQKSQLTPVGMSEGDIPCYYFVISTEGGELSVEVSVSGGRVMNVLCSREPKSASISAKDAVGIARRFLEKRGFESMKESYYITANNTLTVNFAYSQDGVVCYPDLVKVGVALDTGAVCFFESKGYLSSHCERELPEVAVDEAAAKEQVASDLKVLAHSIALIPTEGRHELLCHEFKCEAEDGRHFIIYVNAVTGEQEKILILLEDESGSLTL